MITWTTSPENKECNMVKKLDFISMVKKNKEADIMMGFLKYRFQRGYYSMILVIGARGTGKSYTCFKLDEMINEVLNL